MELLGPSIEKIFLKYKRHFSLLTVVMIMEQILYRIEYLHSKNLIHRDIKPDNFLIGRGDKNKVIYAIDFGLAKKYKQSKTGLHIPYRDGKHLTGTARYTSINTHLGMEQSRRDDIEALGYMMVYLLRGRLPWQGMINSNPKKKYERIKKVKMETKLTLLCAGMPEEIIKFIQYARDMRVEDKPNYSYLRGLLRKIASRNALKMDPNKLDWIVKEKNQLSTEKKLQNEIDNIEINFDRKKPKKKKKKKIGSRYETHMKPLEENIKNAQNIQLSPGRNELVFSGVKLNKSPYPGISRNYSTKLSQDEFTAEQQKSEKIEFSYNIFEIIISKFLCCCMSRNLRLKKKITEKANNTLYNKLDIVLFMRNMILLEIMSKTLVNTNNNKNGIIKFLSRPIVTSAKKEQKQPDKQSKNYEEADFDNFYYEISELVQKAEKRETEKKLLSLSNQQLKELIYK